MVLQTWKIECLKISKIYEIIINFISKTLGNLETGLVAREQTLAEIKIQRGIFQGHSLLCHVVSHKFQTGRQHGGRATCEI